MPLSRYDWKNGPDKIQQHSIAKHTVLQAYLAAYFKTLGSSPNQDVLRLTLIDGFAGGGMYYHNDTNELVRGSPLICLNATREAEALLNQSRRKPLALQVDYFFIEADRAAHMHLDKVLREQGYGSQIGTTIQLRHAKFHEQADDIVDFVKRKSPRNGRSIFVLDQYGYTDVPTQYIRKIFTDLPSAEVILTFGVDSFLNYANDGKLTQDSLDKIGISGVLRGRTISDIKGSDKDWRLFIQSALYQSLVTACGAKHYTPFFIRNNSGHGDYWLVHMSQHHKARDVMTEVHWLNHNSFIHHGGAGLDMFGFRAVGYDPDYDSRFKGQTGLGFEFDQVAREASVTELKEQLPRLIHANDDGTNFEALFATTCNTTPATAEIYRQALGALLREKVIEVVSADGVRRQVGQSIKNADQVMPAKQQLLFL